MNWMGREGIVNGRVRPEGVETGSRAIGVVLEVSSRNDGRSGLGKGKIIALEAAKSAREAGEATHSLASVGRDGLEVGIVALKAFEAVTEVLVASGEGSDLHGVVGNLTLELMKVNAGLVSFTLEGALVDEKRSLRGDKLRTEVLHLSLKLVRLANGNHFGGEEVGVVPGAGEARLRASIPRRGRRSGGVRDNRAVTRKVVESMGLVKRPMATRNDGSGDPGDLDGRGMRCRGSGNQGRGGRVPSAVVDEPVERAGVLSGDVVGDPFIRKGRLGSAS